MKEERLDEVPHFAEADPVVFRHIQRSIPPVSIVYEEASFGSRVEFDVLRHEIRSNSLHCIRTVPGYEYLPATRQKLLKEINKTETNWEHLFPDKFHVKIL
jgi:hypothetical protein